MIWLRLALSNLRLSILGSLVTLALIALSTASIVLLLLTSAQLSQTLRRDAEGIDVVLGATGSPVQLLLSTIYHADIPPGNILLNDAMRWTQDPRVASFAPLSLGDSYRGFRIVGTTESYPQLYGASLQSGRYWKSPMEAVAGATAAKSQELAVGKRFDGAHGLSGSAHDHDSEAYNVVGVLEPTGTVLDRLILTSLESVWQLHDHTGNDHENDDHQVTAVLIRYGSPLAALTFPRQVNAAGRLQAVAPALETSRLLRLAGIGIDGLKALAGVLILTAFLSLFATLYGSLSGRRHDLAMLRCLGANRRELFFTLLLEGLLLTSAGLGLGALVGHGAMALVAQWLESTRGVSITGWTWLHSETLLIIGLLIAAVAAAALPAFQAYKTDVAKTLASA